MGKKSILIFLLFLGIISCQNKTVYFVCPPCNLKCDELTFAEAEICPHCQMELVKKSVLTITSELVRNEINIPEGSGAFLIEGGKGNKDKTIKVFYHRPKNFSETSEVLMVIPGAGRNSDS